MKLPSKSLPPPLREHLKKVHQFERYLIEVRDGREISAQPDPDSETVLSVFDMELGQTQREAVYRADFFNYNREEVQRALAARSVRLLIGDNQVGIRSTHVYAGLAYIDMTMDKETLALYFDLSSMQAATGLPEVEKLMVLIIANERGRRRDEAVKALYVHSKIHWAAITDLLLEKKLVRYIGPTTKGASAASLTSAGRALLSNIGATEHRALYRKFLGDYY